MIFTFKIEWALIHLKGRNRDENIIFIGPIHDPDRAQRRHRGLCHRLYPRRDPGCLAADSTKQVADALNKQHAMEELYASAEAFSNTVMQLYEAMGFFRKAEE